MRESTAEAVDIPAWLKNLPLAPEYRPTETEFADPIAFISSIEREAAAFGICKVIPPLPRPSKKYVLANLKRSVTAHLDHPSPSSASVDSPVFTTRHQELGARRGKPLPVQKQVWQSGEFYTLDQFEAKSKAFSSAQLGGFKEVSPLLIETLFWKAAAEKPVYVEYANDVPGSGFGVPDEPLRNCLKRRRKQKRGLDEGSVQVPTRRLPKTSGENEVMSGSGWRLSNSPWNLQVIARSPGSLTRFMPDEVPGVTSPMVYIGMLFSWFAWHVEDHELHSLNFLHMGSPKTWYAVPGEQASTLEDIVRVQGYGGNVDRLAALIMLGEKTTLLSPEVLVASNVPCCRLVQHPGEFVVTFPRAYHVGFSHGFNCGEAANFATPKWLMVAKHAAVRRAAMNFLPMLSHQQLLYLLSISFISSVPRELLPGVRSSRLRDRKKEEREVIVKKAFLDDMMNESNFLCALIAKAAISSAVLWEPDLLPSTSLVGSAQTHSSSLSTEALDPTNDERCTIKPQCESRTNDLFDHKGVACFTHHHHESLGSLVRKSSDCSPLATTYEDAHAYCMNAQSQLIKEVDEVDLPFGLNVDSGSLTCVACGILGYPFMAILQPSEKAYRKLFALEFEESNTRQVSPKSSHLAHMPYFVKNFLPEENYVDVEDQRNADLSAKSLPENIHTTRPVKNSSIVKQSSAHTTGDLIGEKVDFSGSYTLTGSERLSSICLFPAASLNNEKLIPNTAENQVCELKPQGMGDPCVRVERPCSGGSYKIKSNSLKGEHSSDGIKEFLQHISVKNNSKIEGKLCQAEFPGTTPSNGTNTSVAEAGPSDEITNWNTSNGFLRPRIFCLQHALEAVELLQSNGGVHVLVICHSDYLKIKALAISIAEEINITLKCGDIPLVNAWPSTLDLINISIDEEAHEENGNNWTSKLGLNLKYCVKLKKQMPSNQDQLSLFLGGIFSDPSPASAFSNLKWLSRKSRTPLKVVGKTQSKLQSDGKVEKFHPIVRNTTSKTDSANAKKIYDSQNYVQNGENSKHPAVPINSTLKESSRGNKSVVSDAGNERSKCDHTNEEDSNQRVDDIEEALHNVPVEIAEYPQMHQVDWVSLEVSIFGDVGYSKISHHAPASGRPDVSYSEELSETLSNGLNCREAVCDPTNSGCYLPCERLDMSVGVEAAYGSEDKSCCDRSQISIDVLTVESKTSKDVEHLTDRGNLEEFVGDVESSCEPGMKPLRNCEIMTKLEGNCKKYLLSEDQFILAESIIHSEIQLNNLAVQEPSGDDVSAIPDKLEGMLGSNKICSNKMQEKASESTEHIEDGTHHSKSDNQFIPDNLALMDRGNLEEFVGDVESSCGPGMKPLRNCEIMNKLEGNCKKNLLSEDQLLLAESIIHSEIQLNNLAVQEPPGDDVSANPDKLEGMLESNKICSNKMQEKASESTEHIEDDAHHSKSDNQFIPDNLTLNNFDMLQQVPCADEMKVNVSSYDPVKSGTQIALDNSLKVAEIVSFSIESFAMQGVNAMELCVSTDTAFSLLNAKVDDLTKAGVQTSLSSSMELVETNGISVVENSATQQVVDSRGLCVSTDISSFQNDLHSANFYPVSFDLIPYVRRGKKRKNEQEQEATCEDRSVSFVRSPCEGLRPRTRIRAYDQIDKFSPKKSCTRLERSPGNSIQREEKNKSSFKCVRSKTFKCDIEGCFMSFATMGDLSRHKRNFCTIDGCGKVFSSHKYAIRHQCVHQDCRPLKCPWKGCNMTFKWAWARIEHVRIHTGERPYECKSPGCGQTFRFVSDFSRHRRKTGHYAAASAG